MMISNLRVLLKELMTTSATEYHIYNIINFNVTLTKPVLGRTEVSPLIEDNIEDGHDANHGVERGQSSHRGELSIVVDNHEDEEDENSGYKIHHHLQHQDQDVLGGQSFVFVFVSRFNIRLHKTSII